MSKIILFLTVMSTAAYASEKEFHVINFGKCYETSLGHCDMVIDKLKIENQRNAGLICHPFTGSQQISDFIIKSEWDGTFLYGYNLEVFSRYTCVR